MSLVDVLAVYLLGLKYLILVIAILLLLFGYIVGLHGRLRRLARELEALRLALRDGEDA